MVALQEKPQGRSFWGPGPSLATHSRAPLWSRGQLNQVLVHGPEPIQKSDWLGWLAPLGSKACPPRKSTAFPAQSFAGSLEGMKGFSCRVHNHGFVKWPGFDFPRPLLGQIGLKGGLPTAKKDLHDSCSRIPTESFRDHQKCHSC